MIGNESEAMLRAAQYKDRPSQADQLHFDLWWRGQNVVCDAGSYLYSGPPPWANALAATEVHNTVTIGGRDQMTRAGRFLWLDWAQASSEMYAIGADAQVMEAHHNGYASIGATYRRSVLCLTDHDAWIVVDDITGSYSGEVRLHWLFPDVPLEFDRDGIALKLRFPEGDFNCRIMAEDAQSASLARVGEIIAGADELEPFESAIRGWRSLYYGSKEPALSLAVKQAAKMPVRFVTLLAPAEIWADELSSGAVTLEIRGKRYGIRLQRIGAERIF